MKPFSNIREPVFAGSFYPEDPAELRRLIEGFLAGTTEAEESFPKAYVLPHAGYIYSGPVAATGYRELQRASEVVTRIILLGPSHRVAFRGLACTSHDAFATPLGDVPVDRVALELIRQLPLVVELESAHGNEHSLEVHLPFLQVVLGEFSVVPLVVGEADDGEVAEVLDRLWGGEETRVVISSDLSHYHDYRTATAHDRATAHAITELEAVTPDQACGAKALDGLLKIARSRKMTASTMDLRNSGDTAGPRDRVVGYGAFSFVEKS